MKICGKFYCFLFVLLLSLFFYGVADAAVLEYIIPQFNSTMTDSGIICQVDSTSICNDIKYINIYYYPFTGGGFYLLRQKDVTGRSGQPDTLDVPDDASYYVAAVDSVGNESCASEIVHVGTTTGVSTEQIKCWKEKKVLWFTVDGRKVEKPVATGFYIKVQIFCNGVRVVTPLIYRRGQNDLK